MQSNGAGIRTTDQRGHVLLIAGAEAHHRRRSQVLPSANLDALAAVPSPVLLDSHLPADVVHLDGPRNQNSVLLRLRAAAATPGPLLLYLSGQLMTDRRQRQFHLALPGTTAASVRYTGLPWSWLRNELRARPAGTAAVFVDLAADRDSWSRLLEDPGQLTDGLLLFGAVVPPGFGSVDGASAYTRHLIEHLRRNPARPSNAHLHASVAATAPLPPGTAVFPAAPALAATTPGPGFAEEEPAYAVPAEPRSPAPTGRAPGIPAPARPQHQQVPVEPQPVRSAHPTPAAPPAVPPTVPPKRAQPADPAQQAAPSSQPAAQPAPDDPRPHIWGLAQAGRHQEAVDLAAAWEGYSMRTFGPSSAEATQWVEIRASLAQMAGRFDVATQLWIAAARSRLAHQAPDAPEVVAAAQGAHWAWERVADAAPARAIGPELIALLRHLPTLDPRHVPAAEHRMAALYATGART